MRVTRAILVIVIPFLLEVALLIDWWPERARYRDLFRELMTERPMGATDWSMRNK